MAQSTLAEAVFNVHAAPLRVHKDDLDPHRDHHYDLRK